MEIRIVDTLAGISPQEWDRLAGSLPHLSHAFISALHDSNCVSEKNGWVPLFPTIWREDRLDAAMILYLKTHSWGEYVFDWSWAEAYRRHGIPYYPKLVSCIPFTPVTSPRLLAANRDDRMTLLDAALGLASGTDSSSLHVLFPEASEMPELKEAGMMERCGMQFHWRNEGYEDFDEFLSRLGREKRKKIRQERKKLDEMSFERKHARDLSEAEWAFFHSCYERTYHEHGSSPYLSLEFFLRIGHSMPDNLLMVIAKREGRPIACSLNIVDRKNLYGRYWGALESHDGLHFETCYYQGIEYCIENRIDVFEGGAQGLHKVSRGFMPVKTSSSHMLFHEGFSNAVAQFLDAERGGVEERMNEIRGPFKRD